MTPEEEFRDLHEDDSEPILDLEDTSTTPTPRHYRRIPYEAIRARYIMGKRTLQEDGITVIDNYTLKELAALYNCYLPSLQARCSKEKWGIQRAAYKARLQENAENTALNIYLHEGAVADTQAMIATNKLNKIYKMALSKYDPIIEAYDTNTELDEDTKIDIKELKDLLAIGKELHTLSQQVVRSRTALVEKDLVRDLQQYKTKPPTKKADPKEIENRITQLQSILTKAIPPTADERQ